MTIRPADKSVPAIKSVKLMPRATIILVDDWVGCPKNRQEMNLGWMIVMTMIIYQQCDHDRVIRQELLPGSYGKFHIHAFILSGKTLPQAVKQGRRPCHYDIEAKIIEYAGIQK